MGSGLEVLRLRRARRESSWLRSSLCDLAVSMDLGLLSQKSIMTRSNVTSLLYLLCSPNAHFLIVPLLPFLISVLSKLPADIDLRVFWTNSLRDLLFNACLVITFVAFFKRKEKVTIGVYPPDLVDALNWVALDCKGMFFFSLL
ncbi:hypothetical protein BT96DRAFT_1091278 [Gymnopus androsaceus JB14]|uniref:Uncharacterized protein n=1 Tax=Gymnopus androsaceus JB14 TaxID=1447944 RepID=A0A6A4GJ86_9AGAR|nr:hypothetical protein BT96DRAFT_1091278 [Gymnopus androsaceus JB14]